MVSILVKITNENNSRLLRSIAESIALESSTHLVKCINGLMYFNHASSDKLLQSDICQYYNLSNLNSTIESLALVLVAIFEFV